VEFLNECLERARHVLPEITRPREFLYFVTAVALLIDKRRLEDGLATDCIEVRVNRSVVRLARLAARLFSQAKRKTQNSQTH